MLGVQLEPLLAPLELGARVPGRGHPEQVAAAAGSDRPTSINLMPCRYDTWGNILIRLENVPYPIPLMILSGQSETVDIPVTVRVAGTSPLTPVKVVTASTTEKAAARLELGMDAVA